MSGTGLRVLVVGEDDVDAEALRAAGEFDVATVPGPDAAVAWFDEGTGFDERTVACVVVGADLDPVAVIDAVRRSVPEIPVVVCTADRRESTAVLEAGATDVVASDEPVAVFANRIRTVAATARRRSDSLRTSAGVEGILQSFADDRLVAVFDETGRHLAAAGESLAEGLDPSALSGRVVTDVFADTPSTAAHLSANYAAAVEGDRRDREFPVGDGTFWFETRPVSGVDLGLVCVRSGVPGPATLPDRDDANRKLHRLHDIVTRMDAVENESDIFELAVESAERILAFDACNIAEVEDGKIVARAATAPELDVDVPLADATDGIAGKTIRTGESYLISDVSAEPEAIPTNASYRSALSIPLGESGVFQAISTEEGYYDESDLTLAELLVAHVADALDRTRYQDALTIERDHFAALFENVPDPAIEYRLVDGEPRIEAVNSAFVSLFGVEPDDAIGTSTLALLVPDEHRDEARERYAAIAAETRIDAEVVRETADGVRPFLLRSVPVPADDERIGYLIYTDLAELKARERELERENERLDRFASVVSHDLRNPLTVASGYVDHAKETDDLSMLDPVQEAHDRAFAIIEDVLTLAREGGTVSETEPVALDEIATLAWNDVSTPSASLELATTRTVDADPSRLRQLFENCFRNSVEHNSTSRSSVDTAGDTDEGATSDDADGSGSDSTGDLTITVRSIDDGFAIADDGVGFPDGATDRLFEYGYTTSSDGTGFGLSIVAEVASGHGWDVEAGESPDGGAEIRVTGIDRPLAVDLDD
ncbi:hybrid sensor histidine kinase/response regulator [Halovivax cerinus]|uniref:histidine kinase n=1 Tax=Halovivax cerinus TaxID=1487865 RepID=A0ABD5NKE7_9EURY|nr:GAF domain-containing protein [Halovivax cerinus]